MADINVTEEIIDINVTEEVITIQAPTGAYPFPNAVYSVFGRVGSIVAAEGDYSLTQLSDVALSSPASGQVLKYNGTTWTNSTDIDTGITTLNTLTALSQSFATGTSGTDFNISSASSTHTFNFPSASATNRGLLTSADWSNFNTAYNDKINSAAVTGTTTKTLTLTQQDGGTVTASWTDDNTDAVTSVFGRTGAVTAQSGDYTTTQVTEETNLYFTNTRAQNAITLTTTGTSGAATYTSGTLNIPQYQAVLTNPVTGTGTINTLPKFTGASAIGNSNITDTGSLISLASNTNISSGALGIGTTALTGYNLRINKNLTGAVTSYGIYNGTTVQSDVTTNAIMYRTDVATAAAAFTLTNLTHYSAAQGAIGSGSAVTTQRGFFAQSSLTGATNNYGFFGDLGAATGVWNLYMNGTANNYLNGSLGIGSTSLTGYNLRISLNPSAATAYGVMLDGVALSSVTTSYHINRTLAQTQAATFTLPELAHYYATQGTFGAGSTVTNQYGFITGNLTGATSNYGFFGQVSSGSNRWNLYMAGTADNYLAGRLAIGSTSGIASRAVSNRFNLTGGITAIGYEYEGVVLSDVTSDARVYSSFTGTQAATFTLSRLTHYQAGQGTIGAGSTVTNQYGFWAQSNMIGATNNFGFVGDIPSGTNRWNLYMAGTAANYMAGKLLVGSTTDSGQQFQVNGTSLFQNAAVGLIGSFRSATANGQRLDVNSTSTGIRLISGFDTGITGTFEILAAGGSSVLTLGTQSTERMRISGSGVGVNTGASNNASAILQADSTTQGFLPPRMTTTQKNAIGTPAAGLMVYDTTLNQMSYYNGTTWINF